MKFNVRLRQDKDFNNRAVNDFENLKNEITQEFKLKVKNNNEQGEVSVIKSSRGKTAKIPNNDNYLSTEEGKKTLQPPTANNSLV